MPYPVAVVVGFERREYVPVLTVEVSNEAVPVIAFSSSPAAAPVSNPVKDTHAITNHANGFCKGQ